MDSKEGADRDGGVDSAGSTNSIVSGSASPAANMETAGRPEKSSFSLTCSLLSQYIRDKGSFADLGFGIASSVLDSSSSGKSETYRTPTTMILLPGVDVSDDEDEGNKKVLSSLNSTRSMELFPQHASLSPAMEPEKAQLTIFYGGKVLVYDNFPGEKAKDLMQIASKGQNFNSGNPTTMTTPATAADLHSFSSRAQPNFSELPIARKASLHRFLQKRKDRINAQAPYRLSDRNDSKNAVAIEEKISQLWLGSLT